MDLTPENIALCRQAKELQNIFKNTTDYVGLHSGHFIVWQYKDDPELYEHISVLETGIEYDWHNKCLFTPGIGHGSHLPENYTKLNYDWAWIPRLDQLLEMLSGGFMAKVARLLYFGSGTEMFTNVSLNNYNGLPSSVFRSPEQVAIGLVMYENYNKVWMDHKWVNLLSGDN